MLNLLTLWGVFFLYCHITEKFSAPPPPLLVNNDRFLKYYKIMILVTYYYLMQCFWNHIRLDCSYQYLRDKNLYFLSNHQVKFHEFVVFDAPQSKISIFFMIYQSIYFMIYIQRSRHWFHLKVEVMLSVELYQRVINTFING